MNDVEARLGIPTVTDEDRQTMFALLNHQVLELHNSGYDDAPPDRLLLPQIDIENLPVVETEHVKQLFRALPGKWKDHPLPILLIKVHDAGNNLNEKLIPIVAKTVHLSLLLAHMGDRYTDEIIVACRRARLLITKDKNVVPHLPDFKQCFADIAKELGTLTENPPEGHEAFAPQLEEWCRAFTTYVENREKHGRHTFGSDVTLNGELVEHPLLDEDDATLLVSEDSCTVPFPNSPEEARHDQPKAGRSVRPLIKTTSNDRSRGVAHNRGKEILNRLFMESAAPPAHPSRLTNHQVRRSFEICYQRVTQSPAYLMTALAILTGRQADRLWSLELCYRRRKGGPGEYWLVDSDRVFLCFEPELPRHDKVTKLKGIVKAKDNGIRLAIPRRLGNALIKLHGDQGGSSGSVDVGPAIRGITRKVDKNVNAFRLSRALSYALASDGVDEVLIAWLCGHFPKHNAGMYYTLIDHAEATTTHETFVNTLLQSAGVKERLDSQTEPAFVGTRVRIDPRFIARSFRLQARELAAALQNAQATCPFTFHNRLVLYISQLLGMVTLIRSVTEPFGQHDDSNLLARTIRIADKVNRIGVNGRLVSLGETATVQLQHYDEHLKSLYRDLELRRPEIAASILPVLDGSESYLFFFDAKHQIHPLRPKWILDELKSAWPFPTNWPRHSMSAWVRRKGFSNGAIRALYGHADLGPAPLSRFDGTAVRELSSIADAIDEYFLKHNIRSAEGWNTRT